MTFSVGLSVLAVVAAAFSILFSDMRRVIISAWVASMSVGALFLSCGAEYLAIVQWIVSTVVAIMFFVYATMFGEYGPVDARPAKQRIFDGLPAGLIGGAFFVMIALAIHDSPVSSVQTSGAPSADLAAVGQSLGERHFISLELIGFMLLSVLIGAGVISRREDSE